MSEYFRARKELVDYLFKPTSLAVIERFMEAADKQQKEITSLKEQLAERDEVLLEVGSELGRMNYRGDLQDLISSVLPPTGKE